MNDSSYAEEDLYAKCTRKHTTHAITNAHAHTHTHTRTHAHTHTRTQKRPAAGRAPRATYTQPNTYINTLAHTYQHPY